MTAVPDEQKTKKKRLIDNTVDGLAITLILIAGIAALVLMFG